MAVVPSLSLRFTWDSTVGIFYAELPSGAKFPVSRSDIGGKLEANLTLFRQAVTPATDARRVSPSKAAIRAEIADLDETKLNRYTPAGKRSIAFEDLTFDFEENDNDG